MTKIEWTDATWNPVTGCTPISEGCDHCYARRTAQRLRGRYGYPADEPFRVTLHPDRLEQVLHWRKPRRVFVCLMGDLFHGDVSMDWIEQVFRVMFSCPRHTFQLLTKRPDRMRAVVPVMFARIFGDPEMAAHRMPANIWLGVTAENQARADERIPILLQIPAAVRFVSAEPMLGAIKFGANLGVKLADGTIWGGSLPVLDWVICGAETGPGARPMDLDWARSLRAQCSVAGVPFFFKSDSSGNRELDGHIWDEYPDD